MSQVREDILSKVHSTLNDLREDSSYPLTVASVFRYDKNVTTEADFRSPMIMVLDPGEDEERHQDDTHYRYWMPITIRGFIRNDTSIDMQQQLNLLISFIKQWIDSVPDLGSDVADIRFLNGAANRFSEDDSVADCIINARITYWATAGSF